MHKELAGEISESRAKHAVLWVIVTLTKAYVDGWVRKVPIRFDAGSVSHVVSLTRGFKPTDDEISDILTMISYVGTMVGVDVERYERTSAILRAYRDGREYEIPVSDRIT